MWAANVKDVHGELLTKIFPTQLTEIAATSSRISASALFLCLAAARLIDMAKQPFIRAAKRLVAGSTQTSKQISDDLSDEGGLIVRCLSACWRLTK